MVGAVKKKKKILYIPIKRTVSFFFVGGLLFSLCTTLLLI